MNINELKEYLSGNKVFCMIDFQEHFSLTYSQVCKVLDEMQSNKVIMFCGGLNFTVKNLANLHDPSERNKSASEDKTNRGKLADDREARRRELFERFSKIHTVFDDEDDEDEDKDKEDDDEYIKITQIYDNIVSRLEELMVEPKSFKMIDGINYGNDKDIAQKIVDKLSEVAHKVTLKAIQYGTVFTMYIFDHPPQDRDIKDVTKCSDDMGAVIGTDKVKVFPWHDNTVCVLVQHEAAFDPLCKDAIKYWIVHNGGRASIAAIQRALFIGFNRAGKIFDTLQNLGCIEPLFPVEKSVSPLRVKITLPEINTLFPQSLGWN